MSGSETTSLIEVPRDHDRTVVVRELKADGKSVYRKRYLATKNSRGPGEIQRIVEREADLLTRMYESFREETGVSSMRLAEVDIESASLVLEEAPGTPLQDQLFSRQAGNGSILLGIERAGKWLRRLHMVPVTPEDHFQIGNTDPPRFQDYCNIRLNRIEAAIPWVKQKNFRNRFLAALDQLDGLTPNGYDLNYWSHGDYGPFNLLWDGQTLTAIDYERARPNSRFIDVAYFLMRLDTLQWGRPWRQFPVTDWKSAFLQGFGDPDVESRPEYRACQLKHLVCRLGTCVLYPGTRLLQRTHSWYMGKRVWRKIHQVFGEIDALARR